MVPAVTERHEGLSPEAYPSSSMIGSGALWSSGYTGAGSRIAVIDTGTDTDHQSFDNGAYLHALEQNAAEREMPVDVKPGEFYYDAVVWAVEEDITTGISSDRFDPLGGCVRGQVVTFLWRTMGRPVSSAEVTFTDVKRDEFYYDAVAWAVENDITTGLDSNTFGVLDPCNCAQVVTFLYRTFA